MIKKFVLVIMLIVLFVPTAHAQDTPKPDDIKKALDIANGELINNNDFLDNDYFLMKNTPLDGPPRKDINPDLWAKRTLFVYGKPYDYKEDAGYHRYLGYTMKGNEFTNVFYPNDEWAGGTLDQRNWITEPWYKGYVKNGPNRFDTHEDYRKGISLQIHTGLASFYGPGKNGYPGPDCYKGVNSDYFGEWYKYVHIMQPPTEWTWGMGRMWHRQSDGDVWYITVPIAPLESGGSQNLAVNITSNPVEAQPGNTVNITGKLTSATDKEITTKVRWTVDGNTEYEGDVTLTKSRDLNFSFNMPDNDTQVTVEVNPDHDKPKNESNWTDNKDNATIGKIAVSPPSDPHLILQATSPAGEDIHGNYHPAEKRPQGVAKWGDTVKATLKPDKPSAPRGKVTSWEITSAKITYPKRHPNFTFGHPVQPVSNTTKAMTPQGHIAVKEFLQEWSINGYASGTSAAGVYDWIQEKTVSQYPREYPISAEYSIHYEYKYEVRHVDHDTWTDSEGNTHSDTDIWYETVRKDDSYSDAVSTKLLVNGAARVPLAH